MYQRVLVPVDGSPTVARGLDEAVRLARLTRGRLRLPVLLVRAAVAA
jgi:nucleotide-binding universal stress UspA family protein